METYALIYIEFAPYYSESVRNMIINIMTIFKIMLIVVFLFFLMVILTEKFYRVYFLLDTLQMIYLLKFVGVRYSYNGFALFEQLLNSFTFFIPNVFKGSKDVSSTVIRTNRLFEYMDTDASFLKNAGAMLLLAIIMVFIYAVLFVF